MKKLYKTSRPAIYNYLYNYIQLLIIYSCDLKFEKKYFDTLCTSYSVIRKRFRSSCVQEGQAIE